MQEIRSVHAMLVMFCLVQFHFWDSLVKACRLNCRILECWLGIEAICLVLMKHISGASVGSDHLGVFGWLR